MPDPAAEARDLADRAARVYRSALEAAAEGRVDPDVLDDAHRVLGVAHRRLAVTLAADRIDDQAARPIEGDGIARPIEDDA